MSVSSATFRSTFPAFKDEARFPKSLVRFYLELAGLMLPANRWGGLLDYGMQLFAAHHLSIEEKAQQEAERGLSPGSGLGVQQSRSAGPVSLSLDVTTASEQGAGFWNLTTYGLRFYRLVRMVGMGGIQLGAPSPRCIISPTTALVEDLIGFCGVPVFGQEAETLPPAPDDDAVFVANPVIAGGA